MYEFLAPWGVLVPVLSAILIYLIVSEYRRKQLLAAIEAPDGAPMFLSDLKNRSRLA